MRNFFLTELIETGLKPQDTDLGFRKVLICLKYQIVNHKLFLVCWITMHKLIHVHHLNLLWEQTWIKMGGNILNVYDIIWYDIML